MKRFQMMTLAAAVSMALGMSSVAYANPNNNIESEEGNQNNSVTNTGADSGATAAEYAEAKVDNSTDSSTDSSTNDSNNQKTYTKTETDSSTNDSNNQKTYTKTETDSSTNDSNNTKTYTKTETDSETQTADNKAVAAQDEALAIGVNDNALAIDGTAASGGNASSAEEGGIAAGNDATKLEAEAEKGGIAANNDAIDNSVEDSNNTDSSMNATAEKGGIAAVGGAATDNSIEEQLNVTIGDIAVNLSALEGEVTNNQVDFTATGGTTSAARRGDGGDNSSMNTLTYNADNNISGSFNGFSGQNIAAQNTGGNALIQQQVSFQGNINAGAAAAPTTP